MQVPPPPAGRHVPEPWSGEIESAPLLFIGCNPSLKQSEPFPTADWEDVEIVRFFRTRFDHTGENSHQWKEIYNIAAAILGRDPIRGRDYAVTDIVHCKSPDSRDAKPALFECRTRYLRRVLALANAPVVVALGKAACGALGSHCGIPESPGIHGPVMVETRERLVLLLGAPGGNEYRINALSTGDLDCLRRFLGRQ